MASDDRSAPPDPSGDGRRGFVLTPFRGLRFDPAEVGDLGTVISPPYDVLDADTVRELEAANRRNIVRLILSRHFERPYLAVLKRLEQWRDRGYLVADERPGLYLYEYGADGINVRGLVGLVGLRDEDERVVLPHEHVMPELVDDRAVLMRTTQTNLEPILLVHEGTDRLRRLTEQVAAGTPMARFTALDGSVHQLWQLSESEQLRAMAEELRDTQALIADGHHRYQAYQQLQRTLRQPGSSEGTSPWDYGLAMLVDQRDYPLHIGPIHRSVASLTMADIQELSAERGDDLCGCPDREAAFAMQSEVAPDRVAFVLSDGRSWAVLTTRRTSAVDAAVLAEELLPAWQIADEQVGYHHSLDQALRSTTGQPGVVVAVQPPTLAQVMSTAAQGVRMPRKSTSFGPKPRMGVVMRDMRDS